MILTLDLGTTRTKAVVWGDAGPVAAGYATLATRHPAADRAEQDPADWWASVIAACAAARAASPDAYAAVDTVAFAAARNTFVPVTATGDTLGPALVWSDRRAVVEAAALDGGGRAGAAGAVVDAGTVAAKLAWMRAHEPDRLAAARWLLAPRDLVVWQMTGTTTTDVTLASATGLYGDDDVPVPEAAGLLPTAVASTTVVGVVGAAPATELGLGRDVAVVVGAGDRPCEVLASAASSSRPMVSWGTTANVSIPTAQRARPVPRGLVLTRGALGGWLLEGGLAAAGSLLAWLSGLPGLAGAAPAGAAPAPPPGAGGVLAVPWLGGARAPWWRAGTAAAFLGLAPPHTAGDLARAAIEAVAWDVVRCLDAAGATPDGLALAGGATLAPWVGILTAVTGVAGIRRSAPDTASAGAAIIAGYATGRPVDVDVRNPVLEIVTPGPALVDTYRRLRSANDAAVAAGLAVADTGVTPSGPGFTVSG